MLLSRVVDVKQISPSALRAKQLRQLDKTCINPPVTSASLRRVDHTTPVLVPAEDDRLPHNSAWTSEYEREFRPYERSRYHAHVDGAARRLHRDLKPSAPHTHRSYLMTYWRHSSHPVTPTTPVSWLIDVTCHTLSHPFTSGTPLSWLLMLLVTLSTPVSWLSDVTCHTLSYPALTVSWLSDVIYHTLSLLSRDLVMLLVTPTHTRHSYLVTLWCYLSPCHTQHSCLMTCWCYLSHPVIPTTHCLTTFWRHLSHPITPTSWLGDATCHTHSHQALLSRDLVMLLVTPTHTTHSYLVTWWCYLSHCHTQHSCLITCWRHSSHPVTPSTLVSWLADVTPDALSHLFTPSTPVSWFILIKLVPLVTPSTPVSYLADVTCHTLSHPKLLSHDLLMLLVTPGTPVSWLADVTWLLTPSCLDVQWFILLFLVQN